MLAVYTKKSDVPLGSLVTILGVCDLGGNENLSGWKPHRVLSGAGLWRDGGSDSALTQGCHGAVLAAQEQPSLVFHSLDRCGRSARLWELFILPFIPGLMGEWQGVPVLFQVSPLGLVQCNPSLAAPVNSSGAFPGAEV